MTTRSTAEFVRSAPAPAKGQKIIIDGDPRGFGIRVMAPSKRHPEGARSFILVYRVGPVERRFTIGAWPTWKLAAAREEAIALRKRVDRGEDPVAERQERLSAATIADVWTRYEREHLPGKAPISRKHDKAMYETIIAPDLRNVEVAKLHPDQVRALHKKVTAERGPTRANRAVALLSKMVSISMVAASGEGTSRGATRRSATPVSARPCRGTSKRAGGALLYRR